jgi:hypothetical protein
MSLYSCFRVLQADPVRSGHVLLLNTNSFVSHLGCSLVKLAASYSVHLLPDASVICQLTDAKIAIQANRRAIPATR